MNSDVEEDFPLNGSSKLAKLFEDNLVENISFRYNGPKPPPPRTGATSKGMPHDHIPLSVVIGKTVEAFQLKAEGYVTEGKVGMVVIGNDEFSYYQLYMYRCDEKKVTSVDVTFNFKFQVQEHNYASFKDTYGIQWSIHFDRSEDLISFSKEVALARWKSSKNSQTKLVQDAFKGKPEIVVKKTDTVQVLCTVRGLSSECKLEAEHLKRVISASAASNVWIAPVIGACLNSKKFIIIPSNYLEGMDLSVPVGSYIFMEMEIHQINPSGEAQQPKSPLPSLDSRTSSMENKEEVEVEVESLSGRMARLGYALPSLQMFDTETPDRLRMSREASHSRTASSVPSAVSLYSAKEERAATSPISDQCFDISTTSQFNVLFSEVRTSNSEIRMNISRVTDKVDALLSKLDFAPQINQKLVPYMEKVQMIDEVLNKLVEQNNSMINVLEQSSPKNFGMTINEMVLLKKRNSELESFFQVLTSTNQILKEKVQELSIKVNKLETENTNTKGSKLCEQCEEAIEMKVKGLVDCVKVLEEKNSVLERANGELEKQNNLLSEHRLSLIQDRGDQEERFSKEILEKSKKIEMLEKQSEMLRVKMKKALDKRGLEKEITDAAKGLMNKAYKSLKSHLKEMSKDQPLFDHDLADILREVTREYLDHYFNVDKKLSQLFQESSNDASASSLQGEDHASGNLPFFPSDTPLPPLPRPRRHRSLTPAPGSHEGDISQITTVHPSQSQSQIESTLKPSGGTNQIPAADPLHTQSQIESILTPSGDSVIPIADPSQSQSQVESTLKPSGGTNQIPTADPLHPQSQIEFILTPSGDSVIPTADPSQSQSEVKFTLTSSGDTNQIPTADPSQFLSQVVTPSGDINHRPTADSSQTQSEVESILTSTGDTSQIPTADFPQSHSQVESTLTPSGDISQIPTADSSQSQCKNTDYKNIFFNTNSSFSDVKPHEKRSPGCSQSFHENRLPNSANEIVNPLLDDARSQERSENKKKNSLADDESNSLSYSLKNAFSDLELGETLLHDFSQFICENTLPNSEDKIVNRVLDINTRILKNDQNFNESLSSFPSNDEIPKKLVSENKPIDSEKNLNYQSTMLNEDINISVSTNTNEKVMNLKSKHLFEENKDLKTVEPRSSLFEAGDNEDLFSQSFNIPYSAPFIPTTPPPIDDDQEVAAKFKKDI